LKYAAEIHTLLYYAYEVTKLEDPSPTCQQSLSNCRRQLLHCRALFQPLRFSRRKLFKEVDFIAANESKFSVTENLLAVSGGFSCNLAAELWVFHSFNKKLQQYSDNDMNISRFSLHSPFLFSFLTCCINYSYITSSCMHTHSPMLYFGWFMVAFVSWCLKHSVLILFCFYVNISALDDELLVARC
jgi:hypothetical protein